MAAKEQNKKGILPISLAVILYNREAFCQNHYFIKKIIVVRLKSGLKML
jgi:hypothetical protein